MGPSQIEDAADKIFDLLNDGAKDDPHARKFLIDLLTDIYNEGHSNYCELHQKPDGRWGCLLCDRSWDFAPNKCYRDHKSWYGN